jgi:hypothetical protein
MNRLFVGMDVHKENGESRADDVDAPDHPHARESGGGTLELILVELKGNKTGARKN